MGLTNLNKIIINEVSFYENNNLIKDNDNLIN